MYQQIERVLSCEHIGLVTPTIVHYKDKKIETVGLSIEQLVKKWKLEFGLSGWLCLILPKREYDCALQRPLSSCKSVQELLYDNQVICIIKE